MTDTSLPSAVSKFLGKYPRKEFESNFRCKISKKLMVDPVVASDGYSYERTALKSWLEAKMPSRYSDQVLDEDLIIPNLCVQRHINMYRQAWGLAIVPYLMMMTSKTNEDIQHELNNMNETPNFVLSRLIDEYVTAWESHVVV
jgi:hypothetical protein